MLVIPRILQYTIMVLSWFNMYFKSICRCMYSRFNLHHARTYIIAVLVVNDGLAFLTSYASVSTLDIGI